MRFGRNEGFALVALTGIGLVGADIERKLRDIERTVDEIHEIVEESMEIVEDIPGPVPVSWTGEYCG